MNCLSLVLAGCLTLLGSAPTYAGGLLDSGDLKALGYFKYWGLNLDTDRGGYVQDVYRLDDSIYIISEKGDVHVLHAEIGLSRWSRNLTESVYRVFAPQHFKAASGADMVAVATTPRVFVLDRYTGDTVRELTLSASIGGPVVADGGDLFFGSSDGHLYSMQWDEARTQAAVLNWKALAGGPIGSAPRLVNEGEDVVFAAQTGGVFNCTSSQKILNWDFYAGGSIEGELGIDETGVYVASSDRSLYRLDKTSGVQRWRVRFPEALHEGPVVIGDMVFQYCDNQGVTAIGTGTGKVKWKVAGAKDVVCRNGDRVILTSASHLHVVAGETGEVLETVALPAHTRAIQNTLDDTLYLVSRLGGVLCAKPKGHPYLTPEIVALAKRELHRPSMEAGAGDTPPKLKPRSPKRSEVLNWDDPLRSTSEIPPLAGNATKASE